VLTYQEKAGGGKITLGPNNDVSYNFHPGEPGQQKMKQM
jgi:hypothetical protein